VSAAEPTPAYELRIRPNQNWLRIDWRGLWEYRDLLLILVRRDFVSRYKQTVLGPAWFILQPLLTTLVFTVLFGTVAKLPTDGLPPILFYLCGMLGWSYFANVFQSTSATLVNNAGLFGKVYFPRLVVPLSSVISNLFALALQLATFAAFWVYFKMASPAGAHFFARWELLWLLPLVVAQIGLLSLGVGLWMSALTAKYRDFTHMLPLLLQVWMYATPIIYPLSMIPEKWRWVVALNPLTVPTEALRWSLLGQGQVEPTHVLLSVVSCLALAVTGLFLFQRVERTFVDSV
jgi:lipopolysaccharide transport system permease protein